MLKKKFTKHMIKVRKMIGIDTGIKIHTPKSFKKEKYKWNWKSEIDLEDLGKMGIDI